MSEPSRLTLPVGMRLGPYEVLSPLGAGGMGEVYRARDTRLDRLVAIKVLPEALAADAPFRERFDREARAISQLDHPHICALYDVGEQDGSAFLVLQYLEGETLADRLAKGLLPFDQALKIAIEVASALDHAHRAGITHRDLKPGNVMLTKSGAKLLDFGLAKTRTLVSVSGTMAPTVAPNLTAQGAILGTFQYMAPEQLEGLEADARSDIFAFGAVLYEMLTGKRAFEGKSQASLIGAILHADPPPMSTRQPLTPAALDRFVKVCLAKNPDERWQSVGDARRELQWIADGGSPTAARVPSASARGRSAWMALAAALIAAAVIAVPAVQYLRETPPPSLAETRTDIVTPATEDPISFALSPDGQQIVFVASGDGASRLWLRSLASTTAQSLTGTEGAAYPFWSPDSRSIGFFADGKLKRFDIGGGAPQILATAAPRGGTWNAAGVILFAPTTTGPLFRVPASGGPAIAVTKLDGQRSHRFPVFLPGGRQFLFLAYPETAGIYVGSLDSTETQQLTAADTAGIYASGWLLWLRAGRLVGQRLDLGRKSLAGDPVTLADRVAYDAISAAGAMSASATGLVA